MPTAELARRHWLGSRRVTALLLVIWFVVKFVVAYFARSASGLLFGWPFSFWVAAQGAPIVYLVLVCIYARRMRQLDDELGLEQGD
jgi:putative solute:sodium symporter small subunit